MNNNGHTPQIRISEHLLFIVSRRELVDTVTSKKIKLQVPASLCLERLLLKRGEIVSQEELILCGWGEKRNASVSANAYYQCILHLRKSFNNIGLSDFIVTVPRMGLKVSDSIAIEYLPESVSFAATQLPDVPPATFREGTESNDMLASSSQSKAVLRLKDSPQPATTQKTLVVHEEASKRTSLYLIISTFMLITLIAAEIFILLVDHDNSAMAFKDYARISSGTCNIYVSDKNISTDFIINTLHQAGITCTKNATALVTSSPMGARMNIMYCQVYSDKNKNCRSLTIMKNI
ncbi:winged helix-turn-helix domain-containing protein [Klebsiella sp. I138]|uniref:winged helix-turn-helix domain-containing protein n=1 Tax=Klebsiella sp. I138 TaxID=2755385 RepID=UPI003DA9DD78